MKSFVKNKKLFLLIFAVAFLITLIVPAYAVTAQNLPVINGGSSNGQNHEQGMPNTLNGTNAITGEGSDNEGEAPVPPTELGAIIYNDETSSDGIKDGYLYQYLLAAYNTHYNLSGENRATQLRVNMFKDFTEIVLTETNMLIKSISGLKNLNLQNLKVLNLARNQISEIANVDIQYLSNLEELVLFDNNLTSFTIPTGLLKLKKLNLNKNYISKIDISAIPEGEVYLSFNRFTSLSDITLPRANAYNTNLYVELFNNNIKNAKTVVDSLDAAKIKLELGLQGAGLNFKVTDTAEQKAATKTPLTHGLEFYNSTKYENLQVKIYNKNTGELVKTIGNSTEGTYAIYYLGVGDYRLDYIDAVTGNNLYNYLDQYLSAFKQLDEFKIIPASPIVKFVIKNKEYATYGKISGNAKLKATPDGEVGEIYYSIAGGEWVKGTEVNLNRGGTYSVNFKCVVGELNAQGSYESEVVLKYVTQSLNPHVSDGLMIVLLAVFVLLIFAGAIPLIAKYFIRR